MNAFGEGQIIDGVNEKGLAGGIFYMPGLAKYQDVTAIEEPQSIAPWELVTWALTNFETVAEVRAALPQIKVANVVFAGEGIVPPVHYILHDAQGNSLVVEYLGGKLQMYDDPIGVITNAPAFDWHLTNLNNYVHLSPVNAVSETVDGLKLEPFGQGSGLVGVPGDFTPPSRFVRAFVLSQSAKPGEDGPAAVRQAFHVLDSFDIPEGTVRGTHGDETPFELTQWTTASDTKNRVFYFHTLNNRRVRCLELAKANFDNTLIVQLPLEDHEDVEDITLPASDD
jgi:choloylglycine hydrolase